VLLPALTHHTKLQLIELPGCCLTDASATRLAALLKAQAATAAQQAWMEGLRGGAAAAGQQRRGQQRQQQHGDGAAGSSRQQLGLRVLDLAQNQVGVQFLSRLRFLFNSLLAGPHEPCFGSSVVGPMALLW
jgi:hypothetical protein